jgi:hypothetical protein
MLFSDAYLLCVVVCIAGFIYFNLRKTMKEEYWVIGGEFSSLHFHNLHTGTAIIRGPYPDRKTAEEVWQSLSEQHRHRANYRFLITQEMATK